jgi:hypothetical protein
MRRSLSDWGLTILEIYRPAAIVLFNVSLLFVVANIAVNWIFGPFSVYENHLARLDQSRGEYSVEFARKLYPERSDAEIEELLTYQHYVGVLYQPHIQVVSERGIFSGWGFHETGFRFIGLDQGPWPPDPSALTIFVFGGSTTAGSGLEDDETIPAHMQAQLRAALPGAPINVYNFGQPGFHSPVERVYLESLVADGFVPDIAVFIDGYNDFHIWHEAPAMTEHFQRWFIEAQTEGAHHAPQWFIMKGIEQLPLMRWINSWRPPPTLQHDFGGEIDPRGYDGYGRPHGFYNERRKLNRVIEKYFANKKIGDAVGRAAGFETVFTVQPVSTYKFSGPQPNGAMVGKGLRTKWGYPLLKAYIDENPPGGRFIWCADIQENVNEILYVDRGIHYNNLGAELTARCIVERMMPLARSKL